MTIELIEGTPPGVIGLRGTGVVTADDYRDVVSPAVDAVLAGDGKINVVGVFSEKFERYTLGAAWQDVLLEGTPHDRWGRAALVTDNHALAGALQGMAFLFPGELRAFELSEETDAIAWAAGGSGEPAGGR